MNTDLLFKLQDSHLLLRLDLHESVVRALTILEQLFILFLKIDFALLKLISFRKSGRMVRVKACRRLKGRKFDFRSAKLSSSKPKSKQ